MLLPWISKSMMMIFLLAGAPEEKTVNYPFPHGIAYPNGIVPSVEGAAQMHARVQQLWESFCSNYIIPDDPDRYRVVYKVSGTETNTCSEAIGYGMLLSVLMENSTNNTQEVFDGLYRYYKSYTNSFGLMGWLVTHDGTNPGVLTKSVAATDADEDVALALMFADKQWGSGGVVNYLQEARQVIDNLAFIIRSPYWFFPPADAGMNGVSDSENDIEWRKDKVYNPSYFAPAWYRSFYDLTGDGVWTNTVSGSYTIVEGFLSQYNTGIMPDWCNPVDLGVCQVSPYSVYEPYFGTVSETHTHYVMDYDGFRIGWRLGIDYLWNGDSMAGSNSVQLARTMETISLGRPTKIKTYLPDGTQIGTWNELCFTAPVGVAAMADSSGQAWLNSIYSSLVTDYTDSAHDKYYARIQQLIALMMMSGNFPNLCKMDSLETLPPGEPVELVQDSGFENQSSVWTLSAGAEFSPWHPYADPVTVKMSANGSTIFVEQLISAIDAGASYDFACSLYLNNMEPGKAAKLIVQWVDAAGIRSSEVLIDSSTAAERSSLAGQAAAPSDAVATYVICAIEPASAGKAWFDNVSIQKASN